MRNNKNNIICNIRNITLSLTILMLSFINIINISALSYQSEIGIGFTFNPTLSVSLSSSDLVISNLTPGSSANSNSINVSAATNASYGYTLSVNASNNNLVHSNNSNIFSSIATDADLVSLTTDNTWGYSTSLDNGSSWSNYNGLSSSTNTMLIDNSNTADSTGSIDFKIGARAGSTQASGTYTNTITFTAVTKPTPMTLAEAYASEDKTMVNGFYTMQDMTSTICNKVEAIGSQLQVLDIRDYKVYWIAKLADNHCWMTQNLDLDLDSNRTYTHWDTDLGWSIENGNSIDENATWQPINSSRIPADSPQWINSYIYPISYDPGNLYWNGELNSSTSGNLSNMTNTFGNSHYHIGNYYNWSAAVASNDTSNLTSYNAKAINSICPSDWRIPSTDNFYTLINEQHLTAGPDGNVQLAPVYFVYGGLINSYVGNFGYVWANSVVNDAQAFHMRFTYGNLWYNSGGNRNSPYAVRCLVR